MIEDKKMYVSIKIIFLSGRNRIWASVVIRTILLVFGMINEN
jgi:hypothetical protein